MPYEVWQYITPDGVKYDLHAPNVRAMLSAEGTGLPPIEYVTQRGPRQHGESLVSYFLRPRTLQLLIRGQNCSRDAYWISRAGLLDAIRPNRGGVALSIGQLRHVRYDGTTRDIDCLIQEGPRFNPRDLGRWDEFSWQEILRFIAFNPIAYDPTLRSLTYAVLSGELTFPITFPISFTTNSVQQNITYLGTWLEYPTFVISGPITNPSITNITTGELLRFENTTLVAGETITIDLSYGVKSVIKNDGTNMIGFLSLDSDLGDFHIAPHPETLGGVNQLLITSSGGGGATGIVMTYRHRFIGF